MPRFQVAMFETRQLRGIFCWIFGRVSEAKLVRAIVLWNAGFVFEQMP